MRTIISCTWRINPMRKNIVLTLIATLALMPLSQISFADDTAVGTMANIVINLKHFPSDADKAKLSAIAEGSDSSEAAVATAIANIEHQANAADKEKLSAIVADESAPAGLRDVASVVLALNHTPSDADVEKLGKITH